ncbi:unnamed protein product [Protopolystoma xenopodis]|uniref:Uncharacterized protein n=1 Tax=Protopolystoma xenopodis TaxID=117903 RepID=A0A3S5AZ52_9PLAT|nr:unnamed protein product [Protopolystoma xenopodis]
MTPLSTPYIASNNQCEYCLFRSQVLVCVLVSKIAQLFLNRRQAPECRGHGYFVCPLYVATSLGFSHIGLCRSFVKATLMNLPTLVTRESPSRHNLIRGLVHTNQSVRRDSVIPLLNLLSKVVHFVCEIGKPLLFSQCIYYSPVPHSLLNSPRPKRLSARPPPGGYTRLLASLGFEASESGDEFGNDRAGIPNQTVTLAAPSNRRRRLPNSRHAPLHCFSDVQHTQLSAERPIKRPRKEPLSRLVCRDEEGCGEKEMEEEEAETSAKRRLVHALGSGIPSSLSLQPSDMTPAQSVRELARCRKPSWKLSQTIAPSPTRIRRPRGRHCLNGAAGNEGDGNSYSALVASSSRYSSESTPFVQSAELANSIRTSSIKQTGGTRQTTRPALGCLDRLADPFLSQAEKDVRFDYPST